MNPKASFRSNQRHIYKNAAAFLGVCPTREYWLPTPDKTGGYLLSVKHISACDLQTLKSGDFSESIFIK